MQVDIPGQINPTPLKSGKTHYKATIDLPSGNGDRPRQSRTFETEKEAQDWLLEMNFLLNGKSKTTSNDGLLERLSEKALGKYLDQWMKCEKNSWRANTIKMKKWAIVHIKDHFGDISIAELSPLCVRRFYNDKLESLSSSSVHKFGMVLRQALDKAADRGLIADNPAREITIPAEEHKETRYLIPEQVELLLDEVEGHEPYYTFYELAIRTGMRRGELIGLKRKYVNLDQRTINVQRQITPVDGVLEEGPLKSESSYRTIDIDQDTVEIIKDHYSREEVKKSNLDDFPRQDLVFTSQAGTIWRPRNILRMMKKHVNRAGCPPVSIHDLRHTCATILLSKGINPRVVQERLGHEDVSTTLSQYGHVLPSMQQEAAEVISKVLNGA
jgi:integrase